MKLLRRGKVKEVYEAGPDELEFYFTDNISVFDKVIPSKIPHKGETLCRSAAHWFGVAKELGIGTHFLRMSEGNRMRVRRVRVIADYSRLTPETTNYLIPLEFITRYYAAGSLLDRLKKGTVRPEDVGFPPGHEVTYGEPLPEPFFEYTTKLEKFDREVAREEALRIAGLTEDDLEAVRETTFRIDERINRDVRARGLVHVDGKKEYAFDADRRLMVVDTFGTADEDRWWDLAAYEEGRCVERSKEFVRQYYRKTGYHEALYAARERGEPEPDIPPLPDDLVTEVSDLYVELFEQITGEAFR